MQRHLDMAAEDRKRIIDALNRVGAAGPQVGTYVQQGEGVTNQVVNMHQNNELNMAFLQQIHQKTLHMAEAHKEVLAQFILQHRPDSQLVLRMIHDEVLKRETGGGGAPPPPPLAPPLQPAPGGARVKKQVRFQDEPPPPPAMPVSSSNPPAPPPAPPPPAPLPVPTVNTGPLSQELHPWDTGVSNNPHFERRMQERVKYFRARPGIKSGSQAIRQFGAKAASRKQAARGRVHPTGA